MRTVSAYSGITPASHPGTGDLAGSVELAVGPLCLDRQARRAWLDDNELALKPKTFSVLAYMMLHAGEVLTRERLLSTIWGWET